MRHLPLIFLAFSCFGLAACVAEESPLRILCVGDSITQGGKRDRDEHTYRLPLQKLLLAEGVSFDFIGSRQTGLQQEATWPEPAPGIAFDPDHEGYYGGKTADVLNKVKAAWESIAAVPDMVLIHLGTNDQKAEDFSAAIVEPIEDFIAFLREKNSEVVVLVGHLNFNGGSALTIRPLVEEAMQRLDTIESPVKTVHHYEGWNEKPRTETADTFDWAHPNPRGQQKMAEKWLAAMRPFLQP